MTLHVKSHRVLILVLLFIPNFVLAQYYNLIFTSFNNTINKDYITNFTYFINNTEKVSSLYVDALLKKQVAKVRVDLFVYIKHDELLFKVTGLEGCRYIEADVTTPVLKAYKNLLYRPPNIVPKKCPVPANFHFQLFNMYLDSSDLPIYLPEVPFKVVLMHKDGKVMFWHTVVKGKVVRIKKKKG